MKTGSLIAIAVIIFPLALAGCGGASNTDTKTRDNQYEIQGKVKAVDVTKPAVTLDHQDIPGLMKAMQMEFRVEDARLLNGIGVGDQVKGKLRKGDSGYIITQLEKR